MTPTKGSLCRPDIWQNRFYNDKENKNKNTPSFLIFSKETVNVSNFGNIGKLA